MSYLFVSAGCGKLTNLVGTAAYFASLGVPSPGVMPYLVAPLEIASGVALILGFATRYAAIVMFIFVLVATPFGHRYWTYAAEAQKAQFIQFTKNLAIMSGSLFLLVVGAGRLSVDAMLAKKQ